MTNQTITAKPSSGIFYGWYIVAFSLLAMMVSNGLTIGGLGIFYGPIRNELAANPADGAKLIGMAGFITFLVSGFVSPFAGWLTTKINLRVLMTIGGVVLGSALVIYSQARAPAQVYVAHAMFGVCLSMVGLLTNTVLISNWFRKKRGFAMGIVLTGTSFGGALITKVATPIIQSMGWRVAMLVVSSLVWLVLLPAIWLLVRVHPSEKGLLPDNEPVTETNAVAPPLTGYTLGEALRTPDFWVFSVVALCLFYSILTVVQQISLYLQSPSIGMDLAAAGSVAAALQIMSVGGKFSFGWLSDRLPKSLVLFLCGLVLLSATMFLLNLTKGNAFPFALIFGFAYGGAFVTIQVLIVERFGLKEAGKVIGAITVVEVIGGALGNLLTGRIAAQYGYATAFYGVTIATAIAVAASLVLHKLISRHQQRLQPAQV